MPINNPITIVMPSAASASSVAIASATVTTKLLDANSSRKGVIIVNDSTANLYVNLGEPATTTDFNFILGPQGIYESSVNFTGQINGIWSAVNGQARVTEFI